MVETKAVPVLYQEDRGSRLTGNRVEITVCDAGYQTGRSNRSSVQPEPHSAGLPISRSSSRQKSSAVIDKNSVQSIKSSLFIRSQQGIKKQKSLIYPSGSQDTSRKERRSINQTDRLSSPSIDRDTNIEVRPSTCTQYTFETAFQIRPDTPLKFLSRTIDFEAFTRRSVGGQARQSNKTPSPAPHSYRQRKYSQSTSKKPILFPSSQNQICSLTEVTTVKTSETPVRKTLNSESAQLLKRVMANLPARSPSKDLIPSRTSGLSVKSINRIPGDDENRFSLCLPSKTTTSSIKTMASLADLDLGLVKPIAPGSLEYIDSEVQDGSMSHRSRLLFNARKDRTVKPFNFEAKRLHERLEQNKQIMSTFRLQRAGPLN